jgi:hypothetical protein
MSTLYAATMEKPRRPPACGGGQAASSWTRSRASRRRRDGRTAGRTRKPVVATAAASVLTGSNHLLTKPGLKLTYPR